VVAGKNADALRRASENIDVQGVPGSGSSPVVLAEAGIKSAEILLEVTNKDETNRVACLMASMLLPSKKKPARNHSADYDDYHAHFQKHAPHIGTVINPEIEVVKTIDRPMQVPGAVAVREFADGPLGRGPAFGPAVDARRRTAVDSSRGARRRTHHSVRH
jgi:trk system potassium uptake protein TrkA